MQKNRVTTKDVELHSKKSFIHWSTSGEDADNPVPSPSFSSLSPYLLLLSSRTTEHSYYSHLEWDGMRWCIYKWGRGVLFIAWGGVGATLVPRQRSTWCSLATIGWNCYRTDLEWTLEIIWGAWRHAGSRWRWLGPLAMSGDVLGCRPSHYGLHLCKLTFPWP